jgi:GDPmannose 4,6-dehydratase
MDNGRSLKTLITGGLGQDGSLLAEKLLGQGEFVTLLDYSPDFSRSWRLRSLGLAAHPHLTVLQIGLQDLDSFKELLEHAKFDSFYLFGGMSRTLDSIAHAGETMRINYSSVAAQLESIYRSHDSSTRVFLAGSSEIFPQDGMLKGETSDLHPSNPYGESKARLVTEADDYISKGYSVVTGILFPHESELRHPSFAVPKISAGFAKLWLNQDLPALELGGAFASRDWSNARQVVESIFMTMNSDFRGRVVIGSGQSRTILEVCSTAWGAVSGCPTEFDKENGILLSQDSGLVLARFDSPRFESTNSIGALADTSLIDSLDNSVISVDGFEVAVKGMVDFYKRVREPHE